MTGRDANWPQLQLQAAVDEACDQFETAWRQGEVQNLEAFLERYSATRKADVIRHADGWRLLFRELLAVELELRESAGQRPERDWYLRRFADYADIVVELFAGWTVHDSSPPTAAAPKFDFADSSQPDADLAIGDFTDLEAIGRGGMGLVFKAYEPKLDRTVAIKVLRREIASDARALARFRQEAQLAAKLNHPHVVPIHRLGTDHGREYLVMQYVEGTSLSAKLKLGERLSAATAVSMMKQCLMALQAAHAIGIIHRDLKPANLLQEASTERLLVTDFGLARWRDAPQPLTSEGTLLGTAAYMSPEQCLRLEIDERSDLYSLGVTFYHLLSGRLPFAGPGTAEMIVQHVHEKPVPLHQLVSEIPIELSELIMRLLEKRPEERFSSAEEVLTKLVSEIEPLISSNAVVSHSGALAVSLPAPRPRASTWRWWAGGVLVAVLLTGAVSWLLLPDAKAPADTPARKPVAAPLAPDAMALEDSPPFDTTVPLETPRRPIDTSADEEDVPFAATAPSEVPHRTADTMAEDDTPYDDTLPEITNSLGMEFIRLESGSFWMGSPAKAEHVAALYDLSLREANQEHPRHQVKLTRPFYLGKYEVTQGEFEQVMGYNPSAHKDEASARFPVEHVTWEEALEFCRKLSEMPAERRAHRKYTLPTEAQWEYACRQSNADGAFYFGDDPQELPRFAWFNANSENRPHAVGEKLPSPAGFYDLLGNVAEWCLDHYDRDYYQKSNRVDPLAQGGLHRVIRGGSWKSIAGDCRVSARKHRTTAFADPLVGFRLVLLIPDSAEPEQPLPAE